MRSQVVSAIIVIATLLLGIIVGILGGRAIMLCQMNHTKYFGMGPMPGPHFQQPPMPGMPFAGPSMPGPFFQQPPSDFLKFMLVHVLNPSEDQKNKIDEIVNKHGQQMLEIEKRHHQEIKQTMKSVIDELMPILTPEQKDRLLKDYQMFKDSLPDTNR
jgi:hypothetical protein